MNDRKAMKSPFLEIIQKYNICSFEKVNEFLKVCELMLW